MTIVCLVEQDRDGPLEASLRAAAFARCLAAAEEHVAGVLLGTPTPATLAALSEHGVTEALSVPTDAIGSYAPQAWGRLLASLAAAPGTTAVLAAATDHGNEVVTHAGAISGLPVAANVIAVEKEREGIFRVRRLRWGGSLLEEALLEARTALLTVATDMVGAEAPTEEEPPATLPTAQAVTVTELRPELSEHDLVVSARRSPRQREGVSLAEARVVVGGGRGMGGPEAFGLLEELAHLLGGAVGVSRAVTSLGWRPHEEQIGQTGAKVSPELYLACGISGAR